MSKVFVTGPDGLLGNHVIRELLNRSYKVVAMVQSGRQPAGLDNLSIDIVNGDITNKEDVIKLSEGCDYFIHIAAITDLWPTKGEKYYRVNVTGTAHAIEAALKNRIKRFIHIGSASSFGSGNKHQPGVEDMVSANAGYGLDYVESKRIAQELVLNAVKERQLQGIVLCPTFMIGAYDSKPSSGAMLIAVAKNKLPFVANGGKNWVAARNVATAVCNALEKGRIGESYILGGQNVTYLEMVQTIAAVIKCGSPSKTVIPDFLVKTAGLASTLQSKLFRTTPKISYPMAQIACSKQFYSPAKAIAELELPQDPIENAIEESYLWFKENGYL